MSNRLLGLGRASGLRTVNLCLTLAAICLPMHAQSSAPIEEKRQLKHLVQPIISDLAKKLNLTGTVRIEVTIAPDGRVKRTRVLGGHPVLATDAEVAAQKTTFEAGPRETVETMEFKF